MSKVYKCDICNKVTDNKLLSKVKYEEITMVNHDFEEPTKYRPLDTKKKTKNVHICLDCLNRIKELVDYSDEVI